MTKPERTARWSFDWHEIIKYLEEKYKFDARDYFGTYKGNVTKVPYANFWDWLLVNAFFEVSNGCYRTLDFAWLIDTENPPDWVKTILGYIKTEFAPEESEIEVWISW